MHLRNRLTVQPKGGPFDKPEGKLAGSASFVSGKGGGDSQHVGGNGHMGVQHGTFSGATNNTGPIPMPTASSGGGSTAVSQPTSMVHCAGGKLMGGSGVNVGAQTHEIRSAVGRSRSMGFPGWPQEGSSRRTAGSDSEASVKSLNRQLNQVAPGSQTRPQ